MMSSDSLWDMLACKPGRPNSSMMDGHIRVLLAHGRASWVPLPAKWDIVPLWKESPSVTSGLILRDLCPAPPHQTNQSFLGLFALHALVGFHHDPEPASSSARRKDSFLWPRPKCLPLGCGCLVRDFDSAPIFPAPDNLCPSAPASTTSSLLLAALPQDLCTCPSRHLGSLLLGLVLFSLQTQPNVTSLEGPQLARSSPQNSPPLHTGNPLTSFLSISPARLEPQRWGGAVS